MVFGILLLVKHRLRHGTMRYACGNLTLSFQHIVKIMLCPNS